jgi:Domain of Unknown Function (DUF1080)
MNRFRFAGWGRAWVLGLAILGACGTVDREQALLIDGPRGIDNWTPSGTANWQAVGDAIQADGMSTKAGGYLVSKGAYGDFHLHAEFWVSTDAKSGIFLRCADRTTFTSKNCYEVQIYDERPEPDYRTGSIVNVANASTPMRVGGRWNTYDITARGNHLTVVLNGVRTVDVEDARLKEGVMVLQYRGGVVRFRRVEVDRL